MLVVGSVVGKLMPQHLHYMIGVKSVERPCNFRFNFVANAALSRKVFKPRHFLEIVSV